jgi:hypothetical protein
VRTDLLEKAPAVVDAVRTPRTIPRPLQHLVVPAAAATTLVALAWPRIGRRALWLDEAYTVGATRDLVTTWRGSGGTMGLYYLLMWPVTRISTDRAWLRTPSLLAAVATLVVVYEIGRRIGGRRLATGATGTLAVTWALSRYALEARSYTLALLLVSLSWLALIATVQAEARGDETQTRRWWTLFVVATLLAPLAHGMAALHFASQMACLALAPNRRRRLRTCGPLALALLLEQAVLFALGAGEVASWIQPLNEDQIHRMVRLLLGQGLSQWIVGGLALVAAVWAVAQFRRSRRLESWLQLIPVFWLLGAPLLIIAISVARPYAESRYVLGAVPGAALLVGAALARIRPNALAAAAWLVVAVVIIQDQSLIRSTGHENWPRLVDQIASQAHDGDRLLTPAKLRPPFDFAWAEDNDPGRPNLVALSPTDRVGDVKRFYDTRPGGLRTQLLADTTTTVWYVDRADERLDAVNALLTDPEVVQAYQASGPQIFTGPLYLIRFEPRGPEAAL